MYEEPTGGKENRFLYRMPDMFIITKTDELSQGIQINDSSVTEKYRIL